MSYSVGTLKGKKIAFQNLFETIQWFIVFQVFFACLFIWMY